MQTTHRIAYAAIIGLSAAALTAAPAFAQGARTASPMGQSAQQATHVSSAQIKKYAQAQKQVQSIRQKWQGKVQNAKDKKKAMQYRQQANQAMVKTVKDSGLSVSEYNKITRAAHTDKSVAKRIQNAR